MRHATRRLLGAVLAVALASAAPPAPGAGAVERVPGTRVSLAPPEGFARAERFPGYERPELVASIMVNELPTSMEAVRPSLTAEVMARGGAELLGRTETRVAGRDAVLLNAAQEAMGVRFEKWMAVFGDAQGAVMIVATFPQETADTLREPLRQAVLSARWDPALQVNPMEGLPFGFREHGDLAVASRMADMVTLTEGGAQGPVAPENPFMVIGTSIAEADLSDLEAFARHRVTQTAEIEGLAGVEGEAVTVDGLPAYELVAEARDSDSGTPLRVYQLVVADGSRYLLVQGMVGASRAERFLPQFRAVGRSLRRAP